MLPSAIASEIGPTLPRYIVAVIMIFPAIFRVGVSALVSPTVAVALTVSYRTSSRSASVKQVSSKVEINIIANEVAKTAIDLLIAALGILRLKTVTWFLFFTAEIAASKRVAIVLSKATNRLGE